MRFAVTRYTALSVAFLTAAYAHLGVLAAPWWAYLTLALCLIGFKLVALFEVDSKRLPPHEDLATERRRADSLAIALRRERDKTKALRLAISKAESTN